MPYIPRARDITITYMIIGACTLSIQGMCVSPQFCWSTCDILLSFYHQIFLYHHNNYQSYLNSSICNSHKVVVLHCIYKVYRLSRFTEVFIFVIIVDIKLAATYSAFLTACMGNPINKPAVQGFPVETNQVEKTKWS